MLSELIKWSIAQRWLVVLSAIVITIAIFRTIIQMPLDVFPAFAPPQVEIQTEAPGLAPEEVESLVTLPIESAINDAPGGYSITPDREQLIRGIGRIEDIEDLRQSIIVARNGTPVEITDVAEVKIGAGFKRGDASVNGQKAVVIIVNKQPQADTPTATKAKEWF